MTREEHESLMHILECDPESRCCGKVGSHELGLDFIRRLLKDGPVLSPPRPTTPGLNDQIREWLDANLGWHKASWIARNLNVAPRRLSGALSWMVRNGYVRRTGPYGDAHYASLKLPDDHRDPEQESLFSRKA